MITLGEIASVLNCPLDDTDTGTVIRAIESIPRSDSDCITFFSGPQKNRDAAEKCHAKAIIVKKGETIPGKINLEVDDPYLGYAKTALLFENAGSDFSAGIHESAIVDFSAEIGSDACIGPGTVIGENVKIGARLRCGANCVIEADTFIGDDCRIDAGAVIRDHSEIGCRVIIQSCAVIGSEGFAHAMENGVFVRIPCFGNVIIEDGASIGAHTAIDRGNFGATVIGAGVKLDNLIHIAHNVTVGENSAMAAQVGISGSTQIGKRVMIGGQAGFVGHITIGDDAFIGAKSGVSKGVSSGEKVTGYPARNFMKMRRIEAVENQLPDMAKELKQVKKHLDELIPIKKKDT